MWELTQLLSCMRRKVIWSWKIKRFSVYPHLVQLVQMCIWCDWGECYGEEIVFIKGTINSEYIIQFMKQQIDREF